MKTGATAEEVERALAVRASAPVQALLDSLATSPAGPVLNSCLIPLLCLTCPKS